ncbi:agmatine coumaroyltransferase-2-like [Papaver somniferum]|uniref:agmatine coumaroyltransferase-2-like n=1 Tax=Papaver somniferum TaxID=3469 RepID=UPI000E6FB264|nr:agmatine coumaroyltransferase-2-like [Papaver somniferum]
MTRAEDISASDQEVLSRLSLGSILLWRAHVFSRYGVACDDRTMLERGPQKALSEYREWTGRFGEDDNGRTIILLSDEGLRFIEASADCTLDQAMPFTVPTFQKLSLSFEGLKELALVQVTRFTCGSLVLSFSSNHIVGDGLLMSKFMTAWAQACRGIEIHPRPLHDRNIFVPRNPYNIKFDHTSFEIAKRKLNDNGGGLTAAYSTFECLVAHLWRVITRVRGLPDSQKTYVKISVNGRSGLSPRVPDEYIGNLGKNLLDECLSQTTELIHEAVTKVNDDYFKSFIDFANENLHDDSLMPLKTDHMTVPSVWPNVEVQSWLGFPFNDLDFGTGKPFTVMPSFDPWEGQIYLVGSVTGDRSIDVHVTLFQQQLALFEQICYNID